MNKLKHVSDRPIDARVPRMSISHATYTKGLAKLRKQAQEEHRQLLTDDGIENYGQK